MAPTKPAALRELAPDTCLPLDVALVASPKVMLPLTRAPGQLMIQGPEHCLIPEPGTTLLRWRSVAFYVTADEAAVARAFFDAGSGDRLGALQPLGDLDHAPPPEAESPAEARASLAGPGELASIGHAAGVELVTDQAGWLVQCVACQSSDLVPVLQSLGVSAGRAGGH